jgi:predicted outer membrane repeat protein
MRNLIIKICFIGLLIANSAMATDRYVPGEHATIQAAVDVCVDGDVVIVAQPDPPDTVYSGPGNCNIDLKGKIITVRSTDPTDPQVVSTTVIDCGGQGSTRGFVFRTGETRDCKVAGFTITNGNAFLGGGIHCSNNSSPSISNCVITANSAVLGGGIACENSNIRPKITGCTITANSAKVNGGGIYCTGSSPAIESCVISGNFAPYGGAIYSHNVGQPTIVNCTISVNAASQSGGGIYCCNSSNLDITNCILWGNTAPLASEIMVGAGTPTSVQISYCDIQGLTENAVCDSGSTVNWGQGNINLDPLFTSPGQMDSSRVYIEGDYHLLENSPCIDAGDPAFTAAPDATDIDGNPRISGAKVDMGADEFQSFIPARIKIKPRALNLKGNGRFVFCSIAFEAGYDVADIVVDSIRLNGQISPVETKVNKQGRKLHVKFDRPGTQGMLMDVESPALLTVTGSLEDGTTFQGQDSIKITNGRHHHAKAKIPKLCKKSKCKNIAQHNKGLCEKIAKHK